MAVKVGPKFIDLQRNVFCDNVTHTTMHNIKHIASIENTLPQCKIIYFNVKYNTPLKNTLTQCKYIYCPIVKQIAPMQNILLQRNMQCFNLNHFATI